MRLGTAALAIALVATPSLMAQPVIRLPEVSPAATAGQTIGVTDITVAYHRPAVNKRKIWGGLVPYGVLWRAGANENTVISFSTPVQIEGKPLDAGTYALFMLPTPSQWTIVLSKFAKGWGTFSYDPSEDVLRVKVTPRPAPEMEERLAYTFDDLTDDSADLTLRWEKLRVPIRIQADLPATVGASIRDELRGGAHWNPYAWSAAARWELRNGNADAALADASHSLDLAITASGLRMKAAALAKKGDAKEAAAVRERAAQLNTEGDTIYSRGFDLLGAKKYDDAIAFARGYIDSHPDSNGLWRAWAILGQAWGEKGEPAKSSEAFDKAMAAAHDTAERTEVQDFVNALGAEGKS